MAFMLHRENTFRKPPHTHRWGKKMGKEGKNCELSSDLNFVSHQTPLNNFDETSKRKTLS